MISISFKVKKIILRMDGGFTIARVELISYPIDMDTHSADTIVKGEFATCNLKNIYRSEGDWKDCGENGWQFIGKRNILELTNSEISIISYIREKVKGVSIKAVKEIVNAFGFDTLTVIRNTPEKLEGMRGMTEKKIEAIHQAILEGTWDKEVAPYFMTAGFDADETLEIYRARGRLSYEMLQENPYQFRDIQGVDFKHIDKAAEFIGLTSMDEKRLEAGVLEYLHCELKTNGHLCINRFEIENSIYPYLNSHGADTMKISNTTSITEVSLIIETMVMNSKLNENLGDIYIPYFYMIETGLVENIMKRAIRASHDTNPEITAFLQETDAELASEQIEAVQMVMNSKISILTGGPGTGKTRTIKAILATIKRFQPYATVELAAPTGVAAMMMSNMTKHPAKTIHRLIGLSGQAEESLTLLSVDSDFLIIDESSMLDAPLAFYLLQATSPNTKILFVGDVEQLGCVGAGNIFKDMLECGNNEHFDNYAHQIEQVILTQIHRQAATSQIITNAYKVKNGDSNFALDKLKSDFYFINKTEINEIKQYTIASIKRLLETGYTMDNIQILSPQNKGELGVLELNKMIQNEFNPYNPCDAYLEVGERTFRIGDRVIQTENNYDINVFNGEIGKIVGICDGKATVEYVGKEVTYTPEILGELFLAFAITVHKAQGSEFPVIIMPFHPILSNMLHRKLIYTSITRASKRVIFIGSENSLKVGIESVETNKGHSNIQYRVTGLKNLLR